MLCYINRACEEIDAAMFTGNSFAMKEERDNLRKYIKRWEREMKAWEKFVAETEVEK